MNHRPARGQAFPAVTAEAFLEAHVRVFESSAARRRRFPMTTPGLPRRGFLSMARGRRRGRSLSCRTAFCLNRAVALVAQGRCALLLFAAAGFSRRQRRKALRSAAKNTSDLDHTR